jgi:hypothetical protein
MIFVWIGCNSRAGYLGVAIASIFALWLFRKVIVYHWKASVSLFVVFVVLLVGLNVVSEEALFRRLKTFNVVEQINIIKERNKSGIHIEDVILGKDTFSIKTNREILNFKVDGEKLYLLDENFNELEITINGSRITINSPKYKGYRISIPKNYPGVTVQRSNNLRWISINFYITNNGIKILGSGGRIAEPIVADRFKPLDGLEKFMSGRGYIWSRTIPMLKTYLIKGAGADNYPIAFPQDDFLAKLRNGSDASLIIDKPHNMYMQIGINTGVVSLIALVSVWVLYIISSLKLYTKITFNSLEEIVGASCLVSVIGYLATAMFNDHIVSVSPLFWIILGIGISLSIRLQKNTEV